MPQPRKLHDEYFKKAKAEGYLARSAYKLLEIHTKKRIIHRGDRVIDLGCAPGSWLQVAEKLAGPQGVIVGIDLTPVEARFGPNVRTVVGDVTKINLAEILPNGLFFDVLLSDMAPNTTGHGDDLVSARLCYAVLDVASRFLRPGGNLVMKVLEGSEYPELLKATQKLFVEARGLKPAASRDLSREIFIYGLEYVGPANAMSPPAPVKAVPKFFEKLPQVTIDKSPPNPYDKPPKMPSSQLYSKPKKKPNSSARGKPRG